MILYLFRKPKASGFLCAHGRKVKLTSSDTDQLIRRLILHNLDIHDIEVSAGGLEDAFQTLIQEDAQ